MEGVEAYYQLLQSTGPDPTKPVMPVLSILQDSPTETEQVQQSHALGVIK